jgi:hypothetical protein
MWVDGPCCTLARCDPAATATTPGPAVRFRPMRQFIGVSLAMPCTLHLLEVPVAFAQNANLCETCPHCLCLQLTPAHACVSRTVVLSAAAQTSHFDLVFIDNGIGTPGCRFAFDGGNNTMLECHQHRSRGAAVIKASRADIPVFVYRQISVLLEGVDLDTIAHLLVTHDDRGNPIAPGRLDWRKPEAVDWYASSYRHRHHYRHRHRHHNVPDTSWRTSE